MSKDNCCDMGKTGKDYEKTCKYFDNDYCNHPDADIHIMVLPYDGSTKSWDYQNIGVQKNMR